MSRKLQFAVFALVLIAATTALRAWLASHDDFVRLQASLAAQKQTIDAADARERERAANLKETLAQIDALKHSAQSPAQILSELPKYLSLPQPITLMARDQNTTRGDNVIPAAIPSVTPGRPSANELLPAIKNGAVEGEEGKGTPAGPWTGIGPAIPGAPWIPELPAAPEARIPVADLKPLYDFVQDCRACQMQLDAARLNLADDATKMNALIQERDTAIRVSKGGSIGRRMRRNIVWFLAGAVTGAIATCASGHCHK
jgi:hypothetical protein